jgi:hypothetical protein
MGLDITAYRNIQRTFEKDSRDSYGDLLDGCFQVHIPSPQEDIEDRAYYTSTEDQFYFRAGSYSGYNRWRNQLAQLVGYPSAEAVWSDPKDGPFVELINFSDCEGTLGTAICRKLFVDFVENTHLADKHECDYFRSQYFKWLEAFEWASKDGCVNFG